MRCSSWASYSREQIPQLFGMQFSTAVWNVGYVRRSGHIFLLVTLDKSGHGPNFQYADRFLDARDLSGTVRIVRLNRAKMERQLSNHESRRELTSTSSSVPRKRPGTRSAPFVYCGDVKFDGMGR